MSIRKTMYINPYPKLWNFRSDSSAIVLSAGNSVTGTQCPAIRFYSPSFGKMYNITSYDDVANKMIVHLNGVNTMPRERCGIYLNNNIFLYNISAAPAVQPIRAARYKGSGSFASFFEGTYYNSHVFFSPSTGGVGLQCGSFETLSIENGTTSPSGTYIPRSINNFTTWDIGKNENFTELSLTKDHSSTVFLGARISLISGGTYVGNNDSTRYGGQFVGHVTRTSTTTDPITGILVSNTLMTGLSQDFIDISKYYKPTNLNIFPSLNTSYDYLRNGDYLTFSQSINLFGGQAFNVTGITRPQTPPISGSIFGGVAIDYEYSYCERLERPFTGDNDTNPIADAGYHFNSLKLYVADRDGSTDDRSTNVYITPTIADNIICRSSHRVNKFYYRDLSRSLKSGDYQKAGTARSYNGGILNGGIIQTDAIFISGGGIYQAPNRERFGPICMPQGNNQGQIDYFDIVFCDPLNPISNRPIAGGFLTGAEKLTIDCWGNGFLGDDIPVLQAKIYRWVQAGSDKSKGYFVPVSGLITTSTLEQLVDDGGGTANPSWTATLDLASDYNAALVSLGMENFIQNDIRIVCDSFGWVQQNYVPIRNPIPYTCYLDNEERWIEGYTFTNQKLIDMDVYNFHYTPTFTDPTFAGNINDNTLNITTTNNFQPLFDGNYCYQPIVNTFKVGHLYCVLLDTDSGDVYNLNMWCSLALNSSVGYTYVHNNQGAISVDFFNRSPTVRRNLKFVQKLCLEVPNSICDTSSPVDTMFTWTKEYQSSDGGSNWTALPFYNRWA